MGWALMPWQRLVCDVALELRADGTPAYRTVIVTVPRQNGKTMMLWALMLWWGLAHEDNMIIATAQSGIEAMDKWRDYASLIESGPLAHRVASVRRSNGSEAITWDTGTRHRVRPPTAQAGHGVTLDLGVIDEAWALKDEVVLQSMRPAMATRAHGQLWIVSTAGTLDSVLLRRHIELGRKACEDGLREGVAYFEWAAPPELASDDPAALAAAMPALGHTITPEVVHADRATMAPGEYERAYLNRWTDVSESAIPLASWLSVQDEAAAPGVPVWLGVDFTPERDAACIVAGGWYGAKVAVEVIEHRAGTEWVAARVGEIVSRHNVAGVVLDGSGPAGTLAGDLTEAPVLFTYRNMQHASATFYDAIVYGSVAVRPHNGLSAAVRGAAKLGAGDLWRWGRKRSAADVCPLVACTLAYAQVKANPGGSLRVW